MSNKNIALSRDSSIKTINYETGSYQSEKKKCKTILKKSQIIRKDSFVNNLKTPVEPLTNYLNMNISQYGVLNYPPA
jgi:hypothetical protein